MRDGHILLIGTACIAIGACSGLVLEQYALSDARGGGAGEVMDQIRFFVAAAGMFFYGGIIAVVVGVVSMILQSQQAKYSNGRSSVRSEHSPDHKEPGSSGAERESALEEENRRLREELARFEQGENPS